MKNVAILKKNIEEVDDIRENDFTKNKTKANLSKDSVRKNFLL